MKTLIAFLLITPTIFANTKILNIYAWSNYIPESVISKFQQQTGIKVNISEYDSNETLYAKLKTAPNAGYDIILPSSYYVEKMYKQGLLHKLDKKQLANFKYLNPTLLNRSFDKNNNYSIPYLWGTTGIVVNKKYFNPNKITTWQDLWNPKYKNKLLILNDMREAFAIALLTLHYSINDTDPKHIKQAYLKLKQLLPNIRLFNSDALQNIFIDEDVTIGMGWNGDIYIAQKENPNLVYIYPEEGFSIWIDCLSIVKNAPHLDNAYKFINFLLQPDIAKKITLKVGYSSPNLSATKKLPISIRNNSTFNPNPKIMHRGQFQQNLNQATDLYATYWELLKTN